MFNITCFWSLICEECWQTLERSGQVRCAKCGLVRYCGEVCKMRGWEEHKVECEMIGKEGAGGRVLNDKLRLVARILAKLDNGKSNIIEHHGKNRRSWDDLMDHEEDLLEEKEKLLNCQYNLLGAVLKKQDMPDKKTFVSIYGKILVNYFKLRTDR